MSKQTEDRMIQAINEHLRAEGYIKDNDLDAIKIRALGRDEDGYPQGFAYYNTDRYFYRIALDSNHHGRGVQDDPIIPTYTN